VLVTKTYLTVPASGEQTMPESAGASGGASVASGATESLPASVPPASSPAESMGGEPVSSNASVVSVSLDAMLSDGPS